jgi:5-methylcytosine-specific restriction endonuclease McrA
MSPTANKRPCAAPGCPELVTAGRCKAHSLSQEQFRGSASKRGYGRQHQAWRELVLARQPICVGWPRGIHPAGVPAPAFVADHVVTLREWLADPIRARRQLELLLASEGKLGLVTEETTAWSFANAQSLCYRCHARKSRTER